MDDAGTTTLLRRMACVGSVLHVLVLLHSPIETYAQIGDFGSLDVEVRGEDEAGWAPSLLAGVTVTMTPSGPGTPIERRTSSSGVATFAFIPAGVWELRIERFGYVPIVVDGVEIPRGDRVTLRLTLRIATPPVLDVDRIAFRAIAPARATGTTILSPGSPIRSDPVSEALRRRSAGEGTGAPPSLPPRHTRLYLDGIRIEAAASPVGGPGSDRFASLPSLLGTVAGARRIGVPLVQGDGAGPIVEAATPAAATGRWRTALRVGAVAVPNGDGNRAGMSGGVGPDFTLLTSGPLGNDSIRLLVGIAGERIVAPRPLHLAPIPEDGSAAAGRYRLLSRDVAAGLVRLEWDPSASTTIDWQLRTAILPDHGSAVVLPALPGLLLPSRSGADLISSFHLLNRSESGSAFELRVGLDRSMRRVGVGPGATPPPSLAVIDEGFFLGGAASESGEFQRLGFTLAPVFTIRLTDTQAIETGMVLSVRRFEETPSSSPIERFLASTAGRDPTLVSRIEGADGALDYTIPRVGLTLRHRWSPFAGARIAYGVRTDFESVPFGDVGEFAPLPDLLGISRAAPDYRSGRVSPDAEFQWRPGGTSPVLLHARGAIVYEDIDPWVVSEMLREDGKIVVERSLGNDVISGVRLSVLGPSFRRPRTTVGEFGMDLGFPGGWVVGVSGFHHRSDFLPRRRDLNRIPGRGVADEFGRIHFGRIVRADDVIAILPGSDRRFPTFDRIHAIESDGWSEHVGGSVTLSFERPRARFAAGYTRSGATDNAPWNAAGFALPVDGAPTGTLTDPTWRSGRSDLDIPSRVTVDGEVGIPGIDGIRIGWNFQARSGLPFTPGIRDALGDGWDAGWTRLEPITFSPEDLPAGLLAAWPCLRFGATRKERNYCRGPMVRDLDMRLTLPLPLPGGLGGRLMVDALNLLDEGTIIRDAALLIMDGTRDPVLSSSGSTVTLPILPNPHFGRPIADLSTGRFFRIGMEVTF